MQQPPYQRIAADLRRRIRSGAWSPGAPLPSWRQLQAHYGVGQGAVRLAMDVLRAEGLVEGSQRARLWVAYPPAVRTLTDPDAEWPWGQRGEGETGACRADDELAVRLGEPFGARLHWERYELLDPGGRPAMVITTWWRGVARRHVNVQCEVRPHILTAEEGRLLGLARGTAALLLERTRLSAAGGPVQAADLVLPADRWRVGWSPTLRSARTHDDQPSDAVGRD